MPHLVLSAVPWEESNDFRVAVSNPWGGPNYHLLQLDDGHHFHHQSQIVVVGGGVTAGFLSLADAVDAGDTVRVAGDDDHHYQ